MQGLYDKARETAAFVEAKTGLRPRVGVVLGSGLGNLVDRMTDKVEIDYHDLPHFPQVTVAGHAGKLVLGRIGKTEVAALQGRFHYYEGHPMRSVVFPAVFLKAFGVKRFVVSNSAGGINPSFQPGDLMLITDHINLFADNPLIGLNDERLGPRFPDMTEPYSADLMARADRAAQTLGFQLQRGVYAGLSGPAYETAAEIRYLAHGGADAVGMSTVPEVIAARYLGLEVLGISCVTNMATGIAKTKHTHEAVVKTANEASQRFCDVVAETLRHLEEV
jgi:purine-nucleoside phosphorylase